LIYARSEEDLITNILAIIQRLHEHNFKISAKKMVFYRRETKFCGRIFSADGVKFDPTYVKAIVQMSKPSNASELRTYLASANWIRSSIPNFARVAAPLQELLTSALQVAMTTYQSSKAAAAKRIILADHGWNSSHDSAFSQLNSAIAASVTLAYPDPDWDLCLFTDASDLHWGAAITQRQPQDSAKPIREQVHFPIAFLSGTFTPTQSRWPTIEQEAYAIVQTCIKTSHILQRPQGFTIYTDHRNNTYLFSPDAAVQDGHKQAAERIERWQVLMRAFNYNIRHISGDDNFLADMISRWAAPPEDPSSTHLSAKAARRRHRHVTTAPIDATFAPHIALQFNVTDAPQEEEIIAAQSSVSAKAISDMDLRKDIDGVITTAKGQIYVHDKRHLRLRLCIVAHQGPAGHRGIDITTRWVSERFWWPTMSRDISVFCRTCLQCQYTRGGKTVPRPHLNTFFPTRPNQQLHFDFFYVRDASFSRPGTPTYILVILDAYSRFVWLHAATNADAVTTVDAILQWFALFGKAQRFVSDQGSHFHNEFLTLLEQRCLIQHHFTAAHAPWSNGRDEGVNRELRELLSALIIENRLDADCWPEILPVINFVINNTPTQTLAGHSPAQVFLGHAPSSPLDIIFKPSARDFETIATSSAAIKEHVSKLQQELDNIHNTVNQLQPRVPPSRPGEEEVDFDVGDYVLLAQSAIARRTDKTKPIWVGPARIIERLNARRFKVQNIINNNIFDMHAEHLKKYADSSLKITTQLKDFVAHGGSPALVADILAHDISKADNILFKVAWEGYPLDEATWESIQTLAKDVPVLLRRYINAVDNPTQKSTLQLAFKPETYDRSKTGEVSQVQEHATGTSKQKFAGRNPRGSKTPRASKPSR
jgi:hypothetical protein